MEKEVVKEILDELEKKYNLGFYRFDEYGSEIRNRMAEKYPGYEELIAKTIQTVKEELDIMNNEASTGVFGISSIRRELEEKIKEFT